MGKKNRVKEAKRLAKLEEVDTPKPKKEGHAVVAARVQTIKQQRLNVEKILKATLIDSISLAGRCVVCNKPSPKWEIPNKNGETLHLCSDKCIIEHAEKNCGIFLGAEETDEDDEGPFEEFLVASQSPPGDDTVVGSSCVHSRSADNGSYICCSCKKITGGPNKTNFVYHWQNLAFCSDICVGSYQMLKGPTCFRCTAEVAYDSLGKYSERFGAEVLHFCSKNCIDDFKYSVNLCAFCQTGIYENQLCLLIDTIPGKPRMLFCSDECIMAYYEKIVKRRIMYKPNMLFECGICLQYEPIHKELKHAYIEHCVVCSEGCWRMLLHKTGVNKTLKCCSCSKEMIVAEQHLTAMQKTTTFCSEICRARSTRLLSFTVHCLGCKKKGRSNAMIQAYHDSQLQFSICNLACLIQSPKYKEILENAITVKRYLNADGVEEILKGLSLGKSKVYTNSKYKVKTE